MKNRNRKFYGVWIMAFLMILSGTQCSESAGLDDQVLSGDEKSLLAFSASELTEAEIEGISYLREEEKLARDVYLFLYEIYPLRPFQKIAASEQNHMDAVKYLIDTYDIEDPVGDNPAGVFQNEELQKLYDELIERGSKSGEEALRVGALIEEVDIIDLQEELDSVVENENVMRIYTSLCSASENHLRAFTRVLSNYGVAYTPVMLSQEEFDRIMAE